MSTKQVSPDILKEIADVVVVVVFNTEVLFGSNQGIEKKKHAWTKALSELYDVVDFFAQLDDETDVLVKSLIIPGAIEFAVSFFKTFSYKETNIALAQQQVHTQLQQEHSNG